MIGLLLSGLLAGCWQGSSPSGSDSTGSGTAGDEAATMDGTPGDDTETGTSAEPPQTAPPADEDPSETSNVRRNNLATLPTARLQISDHEVEAWLATTPKTQQLGLMHVTNDEISPLPDGTHRGMLFVFPRERPLSFWMHNTIIPLDILYLAADGRVVKTYTMAPLETRTYPSVEPALYALELPAGTIRQLAVQEGDHVEIPESVLKGRR